MRKIKYLYALGNKGFSLPELLMATFILVIVFVGVLVTFLKCMELNEMNKNSSYAVVAAKNRMEQIKNTDFLQVVSTWDNTVFSASDLGELNGYASGVSYIDDSLSDLYQVTVSICWRQKSGRIIGEDANLDGDLDVGEDKNGNNIIDSPVQLVTLIFNK